MGRNKIYKTEEERINAEKVYKKKSYEKYKEQNKEIYRLSSLRTYYRRRLNREGLSEDKINEYNNKIEDLTQRLTTLREQRKLTEDTAEK